MRSNPVAEQTTYAPSNYANGYQNLYAYEDTHNDWTIVSGKLENGVTEVWLTRPLSTGDSQDRAITSGSMRIIWAWGNGNSVSYHGSNRGTKSTTFIGDAASQAFPAYDGSWTMRMANYTVPHERITTYACQAVSFDTSQERHIVAFRPVGVSKFNHHAIVHVCSDNSYFSDHSTPQLCSYHPTSNTCPGGDNGNNCKGSSPLGDTTAGCAGLIASWAVGMGDMILPLEAGFRVGAGHITHVILEIHYDNPAAEQGFVDSMGFEVFYTETMRQHDAGMITMGDTIVSLGNTGMQPNLPYPIGDLPAQQDVIHRETTCPKECTTDFAEPINVFSVFHHMHYYGKKMYLEKYDTNDDLVGIVAPRIDFWDNGFQQLLPTEFTISPGESIQSHCYYDTSAYAHSAAVEFGPATSQEMCMHFVFYYPKQSRNSEPFAFCGMADLGGAATVCGSLSQANSAFYLAPTTQKQRGNVSYADPLSFGDVNQNAAAAASSSACATAPPPSPPPPSPASPAGASLQEAVSFTVTVAGTVASFDQAAYKTALAAQLDGVAASSIVLNVTAASVIVTAVFAAADNSAATATLTSLASDLSTLSTALGVTVEAASAPTTVQAVVVANTPSPSPSPDGLNPVVIILPVVGALLLITVAALWYMRKGGASKKVGSAASQGSVTA